MKEDNFNDLPEWRDHYIDEEQEGEGWKPNRTKDSCKALYKQWGSIITMLKACLKDVATEEKEESWSDNYQGMMLGDAY